MFEFIVPEGDWDYNYETGTWIYKNLVFTEKSMKDAKHAFKEYVRNGVKFTMNFTPVS